MEHTPAPRVTHVTGKMTPSQASSTDSHIVESFEESYIHRNYFEDESIDIASKDGVVTLSGTVSDEFHKALAESTAMSLPDVVRVENELTTKTQAANESADKWIGRKVLFSLLLHRNVSAKDTTVSVENGIVTLTGEADSLAQKELTTEYAADIDNVTRVNNLMTVRLEANRGERTMGEKLDDASVTGHVRTALNTHRSTSTVKTKVETRDGVVTLTGIAKNDAEKALVTKLVNGIQGVTKVMNEMTVNVAKTR